MAQLGCEAVVRLRQVPRYLRGGQTLVQVAGADRNVDERTWMWEGWRLYKQTHIRTTFLCSYYKVPYQNIQISN